MIKTILVAVDDTPAALAGARLAVDLAAALHADLHAVAVVPGAAAAVRAAGAPGPPGGGVGTVRPDTQRSATAVLDYVNRLGLQAGVSVHTVVRHGAAAPGILAEARTVGADVVILGRSGRTGPGQPYLGSQTREVLEFAEVPVIVVPPDGCSPRDRR